MQEVWIHSPTLFIIGKHVIEKSTVSNPSHIRKVMHHLSHVLVSRAGISPPTRQVTGKKQL